MILIYIFAKIVTIFLLFAGVSCSNGVGSRHIDLIESLQLWNTSYKGLTVIPGPRAIAPAIFLQGNIFGGIFWFYNMLPLTPYFMCSVHYTMVLA